MSLYLPERNENLRQKIIMGMHALTMLCSYSIVRYLARTIPHKHISISPMTSRTNASIGEGQPYRDVKLWRRRPLLSRLAPAGDSHSTPPPLLSSPATTNAAAAPPLAGPVVLIQVDKERRRRSSPRRPGRVDPG
jgi:hypothetical protein